MKTLSYPVLLLSWLLGLPAFAADVVIRLVDVNSGAGARNCYAQLSWGDLRSGESHTSFVQTSGDGRAHFTLPNPLPKTVWLGVETPDDCAWPCAFPGPFAVDEVLRAGFTMKLPGDVDTKGVPICSPNYKKVEEITAKPGEILIFVRKPSWLEKLSRH